MALLRRIFKDIKALKNIEIYIITLLAIVFVGLGLFGEIIPDSAKLTLIIAALGVLVFNISVPKEGVANLDAYLNDRANFPPLKERLQNARSLCIYAPSASNIFRGDNLNVIRDMILSRKDGTVRVIILDQRETASVEIAVRQLDTNTSMQIQNLPDELEATLKQMRRVKALKLEGSFDYRVIDFNPGFSLVVIDPDKQSGVVLVEFHAYKNLATPNRMNLELTRKTSERWYDYWYEQFEAMWSNGKGE
jgi:hypothetical protein